MTYLLEKKDFVLVNFLNCLFNDSIVFVAYIIFLIESKNWKKEQIVSQFDSHILNADEYLLDYLFLISCNCLYPFSLSIDV